MKGKLKLFGAALTFGVFTCIAVTTAVNKNMVPVSATNYYVEITGKKPISGNVIKSSSGVDVWMNGDSSSGVTYNSSTGKITMSAGAYIQNLTALNGIFNISASIVSGSLGVYYAYNQPSALENPEYTKYVNLTPSNSYTRLYDERPSHIRLVANTATTLNNVHIDYDGAIGNDVSYETLDYGMENYYIDPNVINKYANACYASDEEDTYRASKRSLQLTFNNTIENYVVINTQREADANLIQCCPNFSRATFSFKAKFSSAISNHGMKVKAVGSGWTDSGWISATSKAAEEDGWYEYTVNFADHPFANNNKVIRINIKPDGVTSANKQSATVWLDEIDCKQIGEGNRSKYETSEEGLENLTHDISWESASAVFCNDVTFGPNSKNSILCTPRPDKSPDYRMKWETVLDLDDKNIDLSTGVLSFNYKPVNVNNPTQVYIGIFQDWSSCIYQTLTGTLVKDGWYVVSYDLTSNYLGSGNYIRLGIGFDIASNNLDKAYYYLDNILVNKESYENYTQGWENMPRDTGWEKCTASYDKAHIASDISINSLKMTFEGRQANTANLVGCFLSPENLGMHNQLDMRSGTLTASFLFNSYVTNYKVRLIIVDGSWKVARYDITPTALSNGWKKINVNLANLGTPQSCDTGYTNRYVLRIGFAFPGVNGSNMGSAAVWMDDVFFSQNTGYTASTCSSATLWRALDSENILQENDVPSARRISETNPLTAVGIKNTTESLNLQLKARKDLTKVLFYPATLTNENGDRLSAECFETLWAKYVYCGGTTGEAGKQGYKGKGNYPDALVPMKNIIEANENRITSGDNQTIWINVHIPKDAKAGIYTGTAKAIVDGAEYKVPVKITVYNVTMSDKLNSRSLFGCWWDQVSIGMGQENYNSNVRTNYAKFAEDHRVNIAYYRENDYKVQGNDKSTYAKFFAENIAFNDKISTYKLDIDSNKTTDPYEYVAYFNALITKNIELINDGYDVNFFDKLVFYTTDEPGSTSEWIRLKAENNAIASAVSSVKYRLDNYPQLKASLEDWINLTPYENEESVSTIASKRTSYLRTPCLQFQCLETAAYRNVYKNNFNHVWWYGCCNPDSPYPNYHIDCNTFYSRATSWMQYYYGIEGELYWNICFSQYAPKSDSSTWQNIDIWNTDPRTWGQNAGDGRLVYAGEKYGINGPITTQRFEQIRSSKQDYEYLLMLDKGMSILNQKMGTNYADARELLAGRFNAMFTGTSIKSTFTSADMLASHDFAVEYLNVLYN